MNPAEDYRPTSVQVEVNTTCNLRCPMCPLVTAMAGRPKTVMSLADYERVATRDLTGPYTVILSGFSETLQHPDIAGFVAFEKSRGNSVCLGSNALLLDRAATERLVAAGVDQFALSVDAVDPATYAEVRRGGRLETTQQRVLDLIADLERLGASSEIMMNYVVMRNTVDDIEPFVRWAGAVGVHGVSLIKMMTPWNPDDPWAAAQHMSWDEYEALDFDGYARVAREVGVNLGRSSGAALDCDGCALPKNGLYISAEFDVSVCPFGYFFEAYRFGNLLENTLAEIVDTPKFRDFRVAAAAGSYPPQCRDCACLFPS